ncbi:hypothetical protein V2J09_007854 [Rumex salicifolius]
MNENRKSCADCNATRTPLWRTGPAGPRSLCNACGIRYRKRKASEERGAQQLRGDEKQSSTSPTSSSSYDGDGFRRRDPLKLKFLDPRNKMMFNRAESPVKKQRNERDGNGGRKLGEVEEAAFLLMSLSCNPVCNLYITVISACLDSVRDNVACSVGFHLAANSLYAEHGCL